MGEIFRRYAIITATTMTFFLAGFAAFAAAGVELGTDIGQSAAAGMVGVLLLVVDLALPVASSVVMVALGTIYGPLTGALLGAAGSLGALAAGHELGRAGSRFVDKVGSTDDRRRAQRLLQRWGLIAVLVSRPVPVLAETVAVLTGMARLPRHRVLIVGSVGVVPLAAAYATTGALARDPRTATIIVFASAVALATAAAILTRLRARPDPPSEVHR